MGLENLTIRNILKARLIDLFSAPYQPFADFLNARKYFYIASKNLGDNNGLIINVLLINTYLGEIVGFIIYARLFEFNWIQRTQKEFELGSSINNLLSVTSTPHPNLNHILSQAVTYLGSNKDRVA